jgi:hypothetical protein
MLSVTIGGRAYVSHTPETSPPPADDPTLTDAPASPLSAAYQWPATYFTAAFRGDAVVVEFNDTDNRFRLSFDGGPGQVISKPGRKAMRFDHLGPGRHVVRLERLSESARTSGRFDGFFIPLTETALKPPASARQIEIIGDSFAVGIGNTSPTSKCAGDQTWASTDSQQAWGPLTAQHYGADYQLNAISGRGVVRNYRGGRGDPIPAVYPFALFDKTVAYRDANWHPQIIIVALGRNDFLPGVHDGEKWKTDDELRTDVVASYLAFVRYLRARNPAASFIMLSYDPGIVSSTLQETVARLRSGGDTRIGFLEISDLERQSCGGHPTLNDDQKISSALTTYIDAHPGTWKDMKAP